MILKCYFIMYIAMYATFYLANFNGSKMMIRILKDNDFSSFYNSIVTRIIKVT